MRLRGQSVADLMPVLLPYLNGQYTVPEIVQELAATATEEVVIEALQKMDESGLLEDAHVDPSLGLSTEEVAFYHRQLIFFSRFGRKEKYDFQRQLKQSSIAVLGLGELGFHILSTLAIMGFGHLLGVDDHPLETPSVGPYYASQGEKRWIPEAAAEMVQRLNPYVHFRAIADPLTSAGQLAEWLEGIKMLIVALDKPYSPLYNLVNEAALIKGTPWMLARSFIGAEGFVGPLFVPGETPCYKCYELRLKSNLDGYQERLDFEEYLNQHAEEGDIEYGSLHAFSAIVANFVVVEVLKFVLQFIPPETYGAVMTVNFRRLETEFREILKIPRCPVCGLDKDLPSTTYWYKGRDYHEETQA